MSRQCHQPANSHFRPAPRSGLETKQTTSDEEKMVYLELYLHNIYMAGWSMLKGRYSHQTSQVGRYSHQTSQVGRYSHQTSQVEHWAFPPTLCYVSNIQSKHTYAIFFLSLSLSLTHTHTHTCMHTCTHTFLKTNHTTNDTCIYHCMWCFTTYVHITSQSSYICATIVLKSQW